MGITRNPSKKKATKPSNKNQLLFSKALQLPLQLVNPLLIPLALLHCIVLTNTLPRHDIFALFPTSSVVADVSLSTALLDSLTWCLAPRIHQIRATW